MRTVDPRIPVSWAAETPGHALEALQVRSRARPAGPGPLAGPSSFAITSIGLAGLPGKSWFSASVTTRAGEPAGSDRASVPPQVMCRNGAASASSATTITTA